MADLSEEFLVEQLNPLFLESYTLYWKALHQYKSRDKQVDRARFQLTLFMFRRLFQPLYKKYRSAISGDVYLTAKVHGDGIGDYFALLKSSRVIRNSNPHLKLQLVFTHQQSVPEIDPADYHLDKDQIHSFREYSNMPFLEPTLEGRVELPYDEQLRYFQEEKRKSEIGL